MAVPNHTHRPNFLLAFVILGLILAGTIMISSASVSLSIQNASNANFYFKEHLISLLIGVPFFLFAYRTDYSFWKKIAPIMILGSLALMVAVFIPGIGASYGTFAKRWVVIGPINFAPAELFKLSLIIYLSAWLAKRGTAVKSWGSTIPFLVILFISAFLIMKQPDLGTMLVVAITSGVIYFVAGANLWHVFILGGGGVAAVMALIFSSSYRIQRFMIFLNPSSDAGGSGYQINQALLAVGTGGLFGLGFGHSRQKFNYLPEAASDSIFAVAAEELGFFRSSFIALAYLIVAIQGYKVAQKAPDAFSRLLATGITTWIVAQGFLNIAAMLSLIPLTGIPLPFISMGSTSTIVLMIAVGILLNISKHTEGETRESSSFRRRYWWSYFTGISRN